MTENPGSPIASPDVTVTRLASPLLISALFNWALYGVLCVQTYVYSYNFPNERRSVKILAYFIFVLETVQTALTGANVHFWFIAGFGDVKRLRDSHFSPIDIPIMTAVISLIVQGYFCYRIWVLKERRSSWICGIIAVAAMTQASAATWLGITSLKAGKFVVSKTAVYVWSIPSAMADILIAAAMTLLLRRACGNSPNFVLTRVIRLTIETNTLTASVAVATLVLYVAFPDEVYYAYTTDIIGKLYSNTLLVSLNNRIYLRERQPSEHGDSAGLPISDRVCVTGPLSLCFAVPESQLPTSTCENFQPCTIVQTVRLGEGKDDDTSINWSPSHPP